ncbi:hypothetical protein AYI70_g6368 [Smittium culicis]|uniref:Uncharacterized protein n=1 Tax=Smittium culicis TaxID=133412 RepID=A0A1R1XQ90_9FUNG|nr:hypothetical protein AYI70_g11172 [Smittium culicis]OMJ16817.1 hypothetical protein AYI70_g6368 [Smittium culicis]
MRRIQIQALNLSKLCNQLILFDQTLNKFVHTLSTNQCIDPTALYLLLINFSYRLSVFMSAACKPTEWLPGQSLTQYQTISSYLYHAQLPNP